MQDLKDALKALQKAVNTAVEEADRHSKSVNIPEICAFYKVIYEGLDVAENLVEILKNIKTDFSKRVMPPLFQSSGVDSIKSGGRQFILNPEFHASIPQDKQAKGFPFLREIGYEYLLKEGVNSQSLSTAMKEYIKEKGELPPDDVMTIHIGHYISMRKAK